MPKSTVAGHPIHPMLIVAPAALIPFGLILDVMHQASGKQSYADAAYYSKVGGLLGGLAAGAAGAMDYLTIEPHTEVKQTANVHALLNIGALLLTAINVKRGPASTGHAGGSIALSGLATAGVMISGWYGARMVYEQGVRVKTASPIEHKPEVKIPGDEIIHDAFIQPERHMPSTGPSTH